MNSRSDAAGIAACSLQGRARRSHFAHGGARSFGAALLLAVSSVLAAEAAEPVATHAPTVAPAAIIQGPAAVDLGPAFDRWSLARRRQGDRPTCSVFTVVGALEYAIGTKEGQCPRLSPEFLNWAANQIDGDTSDGGFFSDLWSGFARYGIASEQDCPYAPRFEAGHAPGDAALADARARLGLGLRFHWIKPWDVTTGLTDAQLVAIRETLQAGWPVCGGFRWPKQERWANGVLQLCGPEAVRDGHSVLLVGYQDDPAQPGGGVFKFRNTSGDAHDGFMPYDYAKAYMNDAAWVGLVKEP